jgi:hypothetical protein
VSAFAIRAIGVATRRLAEVAHPIERAMGNSRRTDQLFDPAIMLWKYSDLKVRDRFYRYSDIPHFSPRRAERAV